MENDMRDQKEVNQKILDSLNDIKTKLLTNSIYLSVGVSGVGLVVGNWDKIAKLF